MSDLFEGEDFGIDTANLTVDGINILAESRPKCKDARSGGAL